MPALSLEAEREAVQQIAIAPNSAEAAAARTRLIEGNLHLVMRLARRYEPSGVELADLIQEGNLALTRAAHRFDPQRSPLFRPFAIHLVYWALYSVVNAHLTERYLSESETEPIRPLRASVLKALAHNAIDEQAVVFDLPEERFVSLTVLLEAIDDEAFSPDNLSSIHQSLSEEAVAETLYLAQEQSRALAAWLQKLTTKERFVLTCSYLLDIVQTREEVARTLHVTREHVREIEQRCLRKMRHPHLARMLR